MGVSGTVIYFRVDSNNVIAGGHVMRCIALAGCFKKAGEKVRFLVADENPVPFLEQYQMDYRVLNSDWKDLMTDLKTLIEILKEDPNPLLIIDTYQISRSYVESLAPFCKVIYLGSKQEQLGPLDAIINYSTDIDPDFYSSYGAKTKLLLGPSYAPLREEFQTISHTYRQEIGKVLLTTGNTDQYNVVGALLEKLTGSSEYENITFEVVIGRMFEKKELLHERYDQDARISLHENVRSMSSLIAECDIALSANGTTVYELSAVGVPAITFAVAEEQVKSAEAMEKLGIIDYCGPAYTNQEECIDKIADRLKYYREDNDALLKLAHRAHGLIDGQGCRKIVQAVLALEG